MGFFQGLKTTLTLPGKLFRYAFGAFGVGKAIIGDLNLFTRELSDDTALIINKLNETKVNSIEIDPVKNISSKEMAIRVYNTQQLINAVINKIFLHLLINLAKNKECISKKDIEVEKAFNNVLGSSKKEMKALIEKCDLFFYGGKCSPIAMMISAIVLPIFVVMTLVFLVGIILGDESGKLSNVLCFIIFLILSIVSLIISRAASSGALDHYNISTFLDKWKENKDLAKNHEKCYVRNFTAVYATVFVSLLFLVSFCVLCIILRYHDLDLSQPYDVCSIIFYVSMSLSIASVFAIIIFSFYCSSYISVNSAILFDDDVHCKNIKSAIYYAIANGRIDSGSKEEDDFVVKLLNDIKKEMFDINAEDKKMQEEEFIFIEEELLTCFDIENKEEGILQKCKVAIQRCRDAKNESKLISKEFVSFIVNNYSNKRNDNVIIRNVNMKLFKYDQSKGAYAEVMAHSSETIIKEIEKNNRVINHILLGVNNEICCTNEPINLGQNKEFLLSI